MTSHHRRRRATIRLPALDAGYALTLVDIFERAIKAIWRAHGDRMSELAALRAAARRPRRTDYADDGDPNAPADRDF